MMNAIIPALSESEVNLVYIARSRPARVIQCDPITKEKGKKEWKKEKKHHYYF